MKDYFYVEVRADERVVYESIPFTTSHELVSIAYDIANKFVQYDKKADYDVKLYRNDMWEDIHCIILSDDYFCNFCEIITALYYHCDLDLCF